MQPGKCSTHAVSPFPQHCFRLVWAQLQNPSQHCHRQPLPTTLHCQEK